MDEINEQRQNMQDLTDVLSQPIGAGVDIDEDDLENELKVGQRSQVSGTLLGWLVACRVALTSDGFWLASAREGLSLIDQWHSMPHAVSHSMLLMRDLQVWLAVQRAKASKEASASCSAAGDGGAGLGRADAGACSCALAQGASPCPGAACSRPACCSGAGCTSAGRSKEASQDTGRIGAGAA